MIPEAFITQWQESAPWQQPDMIEQDLIICRALVQLFNSDRVKRNLAFRGGTALYKLYLVPAARYSEDIDLVQINNEPIGETINSIHDVLDPWLGKPHYDSKDQSFRLTYRFTSQSGMPLRLKVEINTREQVYEVIQLPFTVESRWFTDQALITTFPLPELLGTKLRALYQRKKGRDLFDLDYALKHSDVDEEKIVSMFVRYVHATNLQISSSEFRANLEQKRADKQFRQDIYPLLRTGIKYDVDEAIEIINSRLVTRIDLAWRSI